MVEIGVDLGLQSIEGIGGFGFLTSNHLATEPRTQNARTTL